MEVDPSYSRLRQPTNINKTQTSTQSRQKISIAQAESTDDNDY